MGTTTLTAVAIRCGIVVACAAITILGLVWWSTAPRQSSHSSDSRLSGEEEVVGDMRMASTAAAASLICKFCVDHPDQCGTPGQYCPSSFSFPDVCPAAYFCPALATKFLCPAGSYCRKGSDAPTPCPALTTCPAGTKAPNKGVLGLVLDLLLFVLGYVGYQVFLLIRDKQRDQRQREHDIESFNPMAKRQRRMSQVRNRFAKFSKFNSVALALGFRDLCYFLPDGKCILKNVTGSFDTGRLIAIMGPSGAGKTTLLRLLAGRLSAGPNCIRGTILVNGKTTTLESFRSVVGFVPQDDIMLGNLTVKENIRYSALGRLPADWKLRDKLSRINDVLSLLELREVRHSKVGDESERGVSGGQRKRVNIGLELIANPAMLFLDEPTSGLDSAASNHLMRTLKNLAQSGMSVVCVVHQPRYEVFELFDDLCLLARGGEVAYLGPVKDAVTYFVGLGYQPPRAFVNPADWVIDVVAGDAPGPGDTKPDRRSSFYGGGGVAGKATGRALLEEDDDVKPTVLSDVEAGHGGMRAISEASSDSESESSAPAPALLGSTRAAVLGASSGRALHAPVAGLAAIRNKHAAPITRNPLAARKLGVGLAGHMPTVSGASTQAQAAAVTTQVAPAGATSQAPPAGTSAQSQAVAVASQAPPAGAPSQAPPAGRQGSQRSLRPSALSPQSSPAIQPPKSTMPALLIRAAAAFSNLSSPAFRPGGQSAELAQLQSHAKPAFHKTLPAKWKAHQAAKLGAEAKGNASPVVGGRGEPVDGEGRGRSSSVVHRLARSASTMFKAPEPEPQLSDIVNARQLPGFWYQTCVFTVRSFNQQIISLAYLSIELALVCAAGAILGYIYYDSDDDSHLLQTLSLSCLVVGMTSINASEGWFFKEVNVYLREQAVGYSRAAYLTAKFVSHLPLIFLTPAVYLSFYYTFSAPRASLNSYYGYLLLVQLVGTGVGYCVPLLFKGKAQLAGVIFPLICTMFSGVSPSMQDLADVGFFGTGLASLSYSRWAVELMYLANAEHRNPDLFHVQSTVDALRYSWSTETTGVLVLLALAIFFRFLTCLLLYRVQVQARRN